ncbi:hypothetical protein QCA50_000975 [Cerrena zonata]|uniref:Uncharacterized protein n=1 Tax=Cerrena zonata TaxID=2478898 RepID=A0AAW0GS24_9APHY
MGRANAVTVTTQNRSKYPRGLSPALSGHLEPAAPSSDGPKTPRAQHWLVKIARALRLGGNGMA